MVGGVCGRSARWLPSHSLVLFVHRGLWPGGLGWWAVVVVGVVLVVVVVGLLVVVVLIMLGLVLRVCFCFEVSENFCFLFILNLAGFL